MENTRENINVISLRLGRIFPELKRKLSKAKSIEDILIIVRSQCNLTDVTRLTTIKVDQLSADVSAYKSEMKTACRILHRSVKDNLSQYQHLIFKLTEAENVKDITDAENVKDILALLRKSFLSEIPRVSLCVKSSKVSYTMVAVGGHSFILIIAVDFIIIVVIIWNYWKNDADASSKQTVSIIVIKSNADFMDSNRTHRLQVTLLKLSKLLATQVVKHQLQITVLLVLKQKSCLSTISLAVKYELDLFKLRITAVVTAAVLVVKHQLLKFQVTAPVLVVKYQITAL